jgi:hypothetical protein
MLSKTHADLSLSFFFRFLTSDSILNRSWKNFEPVLKKKPVRIHPKIEKYTLKAGLYVAYRVHSRGKLSLKRSKRFAFETKATPMPMRIVIS